MSLSSYKYDIFLSYANKDMIKVDFVTEELKSNKLSVFEAHNTLQKKIGHSFIESLQEAIINSKDFVLVWTKNAVSSDWVKKEYETFINKCNISDRENRRIIIYVTKEEDIKLLLPPFLADYQSCKSLKDLVYCLTYTEDIKSHFEKKEREKQKLIEKVNIKNKEIDKFQVTLSSLKEEQTRFERSIAKRDEIISIQRSKINEFINKIEIKKETILQLNDKIDTERNECISLNRLLQKKENELKEHLLKSDDYEKKNKDLKENYNKVKVNETKLNSRINKLIDESNDLSRLLEKNNDILKEQQNKITKCEKKNQELNKKYDREIINKTKLNNRIYSLNQKIKDKNRDYKKKSFSIQLINYIHINSIYTFNIQYIYY
ncbi:hypothetical protein MHK_002549 [Candidatus Magnetomorum sp. HK-1]|nr:hypothetical protein MHK_002549 [Candidatus Magnetomorum sp. HK-1]